MQACGGRLVLFAAKFWGRIHGLHFSERKDTEQTGKGIGNPTNKQAIETTYTRGTESLRAKGLYSKQKAQRTVHHQIYLDSVPDIKRNHYPTHW